MHNIYFFYSSCAPINCYNENNQDENENDWPFSKIKESIHEIIKVLKFIIFILNIRAYLYVITKMERIWKKKQKNLMNIFIRIAINSLKD